MVQGMSFRRFIYVLEYFNISYYKYFLCDLSRLSIYGGFLCLTACGSMD